MMGRRHSARISTKKGSKIMTDPQISIPRLLAPIPYYVTAQIVSMQQRIPVLSPFIPDGWIDFRSGYGRGFRAGVFVKIADADKFEDRSIDIKFITVLTMKGVFDSVTDARTAMDALQREGYFCRGEFVADGLSSVEFLVPQGERGELARA